MKTLAKVVIGLLLLGGVAAAAVLALKSSGPTGPVEVVWDREPCAFCRMHVGDPAFAVQLQTLDGEVHNFDDTGCYFRFARLHAGRNKAVYFHHHTEDRWLRLPDLAFVEVPHSPMGFNLGAVDRARGRLSLEQARKRVFEPAEQPGEGAAP